MFTVIICCIKKIIQKLNKTWLTLSIISKHPSYQNSIDKLLKEFCLNFCWCQNIGDSKWQTIFGFWKFMSQLYLSNLKYIYIEDIKLVNLVIILVFISDGSVSLQRFIHGNLAPYWPRSVNRTSVAFEYNFGLTS